jgi:hypothetical protein
MVSYARNETLFFSEYASMFDDLAAMSYNPLDLTVAIV